MRLRVGSFCRLVYQGTEYSGGGEFDVPDESAEQWLRTGLVTPADGVWPVDGYSNRDRHGNAPAASSDTT